MAPFCCVSDLCASSRVEYRSEARLKEGVALCFALSSGNSFESVTDARGAYLVAVRIGTYQITATLAGFGTVSRTLELQVGQTTVVNLRLAYESALIVPRRTCAWI